MEQAVLGWENGEPPKDGNWLGVPRLTDLTMIGLAQWLSDAFKGVESGGAARDDLEREASALRRRIHDWLRCYDLPGEDPSWTDDAFVWALVECSGLVALDWSAADVVASVMAAAEDAIRHLDKFLGAPADSPDPLSFAINFSSVMSTFFPQTDRRAEVERKLLDAALREIRFQLDAAAAAARNTGLIPTPRKVTGREHFRWLVRYHVMNETYAEIATDAGKSRQSVTEATKATAALIGLPLRPASDPGRPRKPRPPARSVRVVTRTR